MEIVAGDIGMENTIRKSLGRLSVRFSELEDTIDISAGKRRIYALRSEESELLCHLLTTCLMYHSP